MQLHVLNATSLLSPRRKATHALALATIVAPLSAVAIFGAKILPTEDSIYLTTVVHGIVNPNSHGSAEAGCARPCVRSATYWTGFWTGFQSRCRRPNCAPTCFKNRWKTKLCPSAANGCSALAAMSSLRYGMIGIDDTETECSHHRLVRFFRPGPHGGETRRTPHRWDDTLVQEHHSH